MATLSPLRRWIKKTLITQIPVGTIWSDTNGAAFKTLTGVSHLDLLRKWFTVVKGTPNYNITGADPRFTTCSSFLPRFATQVRIAGGLPIKMHNSQLNKDFDIGLRGFELNVERGWTPAFLGDSVAGG